MRVGLGSDGRGLANLGRGSRGLAGLRSDAVGSPASGSLASGAVAASIFFYTRKKREEWMTGGLHMSGRVIPVLMPSNQTQARDEFILQTKY